MNRIDQFSYLIYSICLIIDIFKYQFSINLIKKSQSIRKIEPNHHILFLSSSHSQPLFPLNPNGIAPLTTRLLIYSSSPSLSLFKHLSANLNLSSFCFCFAQRHEYLPLHFDGTRRNHRHIDGVKKKSLMMLHALDICFDSGFCFDYCWLSCWS